MEVKELSPKSMSSANVIVRCVYEYRLFAADDFHCGEKWAVVCIKILP
jgi:hypothetical protein